MSCSADIEAFISRFEARVAPAEKAAKEAWWNLATTGTEEAQKELVRAGMEYNRLFADQGLLLEAATDSTCYDWSSLR